MSSTSMEDDESIVPLLFDENNENYMETCDDEVNDIVPRLERLNISDNEPIYLPSNNMDIPDSSMNVVPSSINNFKEAPISDSDENVYPVFESADMISADADTVVAVGSQISLSGTDEISQVFSTNSQSQDFISNAVGEEIHMLPMYTKEEKILNASKESAETAVESIFDESPLDLSLKSRMDTIHSSSAISENENELPSLVVVPEKTKHVDPETGEMAKNSDIILQGTSGSDSKGKTMDQFADQMDSGIVFDLDSSKSSYAADVSSDDQSHKSSGIMVDSPPDTPDIGDVNVASVGNERSRKIAIVPSVLVTKEIGQRPLVIFQPPSKTSSSSDGDSKNSCFTGKHSHKNRRKSKKIAKLKNKNASVVKENVKSPPKPINPNHSIVKKEEKRPSPCKRKNSETMTQTTGKFHKRSSSEHNSETAEKTHSLNRSRSLSPGESASVANPLNRNSISPGKNSIPRSRKRANSDCNTASRVKFRRPSTSSDDSENK